MSTERDLQMLQHVVRYRLTTRAILRELFLPTSTVNAANKVVARLVQSRWLNDRRSAGGFSYLTLGVLAPVNSAGSVVRVGRFTEQSLPLAYGLLALCVRRGFQRLTNREFEAAFPELGGAQSRNGSYFVDTSEEPYRLSTVLLDRGNAPRDLLSKLDRLAQQRYRLPAFVDLIHCQRFSITIMTAEPLKAKLLERAIQLKYRGRTRIKVAVVTELQGFFRRI